MQNGVHANSRCTCVYIVAYLLWKLQMYLSNAILFYVINYNAEGNGCRKCMSNIPGCIDNDDTYVNCLCLIYFTTVGRL